MNVFREMRERVFSSSLYYILLIGTFICSIGDYAVSADKMDWGWKTPPTFPNEAYGPRTDINPDLIGDNHLFDVWVPDGEGPYPVMIYAHGGGFKTGSKVKAIEGRPKLVEDNVVFISINYTLLQGPAIGNNDGVDAITYIKSNHEKYRIDPEKIFLSGNSAGGIMMNHIIFDRKMPGILGAWHGAYHKSQFADLSIDNLKEVGVPIAISMSKLYPANLGHSPLAAVTLLEKNVAAGNTGMWIGSIDGNVEQVWKNGKWILDVNEGIDTGESYPDVAEWIYSIIDKQTPTPTTVIEFNHIGPAGDSEKKISSMPVDVSAFTHEIDQLVGNELKRLDQEPRPEIGDYTFCRRIYLDAIGRIPTIDELESFVCDGRSDKRARLIDKLLNSKGYNSHWYNYWADLLRVKDVGDKLHHSGNFSEWIKDSVRRNKPYNQMAHELINASGELYKPGNGATGFYAREPMPLDHLANSVKTFMGMSIECAQCHDHPFEDWTQQDFYKLAAFTSKTHLRVDPLPKDEKETYAKDRRILKQKDFDEWIVYRESIRVKHAAIYGNGTGFMRLPHDYQYKDGEPHQVMEANVLFGNMPVVNYLMTKEKLESLPEHHFGPGVNARKSMADWMTSQDNPMFTKATVNRLWQKVMGTVLVGQLGGLTQEAMGKHPALTEKLILIMKASKYDTKVFLSALFNSLTYQSKALALSATPPAYLLDGPVVRRLAAEVIVDSFLSLTTETPDNYVATEFRWDGFTHFYEKSQDMTVKDFVDYSIKGPGRGQFQSREEREAQRRNGDMGPKELWRVSTFGRNYKQHWMAMLMGKSNRELIDDSNLEPDIPQILFMMNGLGIPEDALIYRKLSSAANHREKMELIWKAILGRLPKESEESLYKHTPDDVIWALLNSNEFRFER